MVSNEWKPRLQNQFFRATFNPFNVDGFQKSGQEIYCRGKNGGLQWCQNIVPGINTDLGFEVACPPIPGSEVLELLRQTYLIIP